MQNPDRLRVTAEARALAVCVYELTTRFPAEERFGLVAQMRRAAVSVGSTIAEGCGRRGNGELLHYLYMSSGSASELAYQLTIAEALGLGWKESREGRRAGGTSAANAQSIDRSLGSEAAT